MNDELTQMIPDPWKSLVHFLTIPVSWIPDMQRALMDFVLASSTGWLSGVYYLLLLFPVLLWIGAVWCTHLTPYTLPFRSGRIELDLWRRHVPRERVRLWTVDGEVMKTWREKLEPNRDLGEQVRFWKWLQDTVDYRVRSSKL